MSAGRRALSKLVNRPRILIARVSAMSFRNRLVLLSTAAVATAVVLASVIVFFIVRGELRRQVDNQLRNLVANVSLLSNSVRPPGGQQGVVLLPADRFGSSAGYAQVVQPNGNVLRPLGTTVRLPVERRTLTVAQRRDSGFFSDHEVGGEHVRMLTASLPTGGAVQAVRTLEEVDRSLRRLAIALVLVSLGGIALAVWLGRLVARTALKPVGQLTDAAEHVALTRDLSRRMEASGGDELSRLGASFNTMLEALEESQNAQRQLVADASHELRTPLTSLRTNVEVLANVDALPKEDRERLLVDVVGQIEELTALVSDLVDLARGAEPELEVEEVRLDMLVGETVARVRRHAPDRQFELDLEPSLVRAVPARLDRAVGNLIDNAAKWSPPGGVIDVEVRDGEVSVRDRGPGIDEADLPFIFERFYRAPAARNLPGSGLGLAIVRQVAELHGGRVTAEGAEGGGARFRLRLPAVEVAGAEPARTAADPA